MEAGTVGEDAVEAGTVKRIGVIGVGEIGRAVVTGLCEGAGEHPEIFLSPRGARTAAELSARYEGVRVCGGNQEVVDRSDLVLVAVRGRDRHEALSGLRVDGGKVVVNVMAGVGVDDLRPCAASSRGSGVPWATGPVPFTGSPPTTRPRAGATSASVPPGSARPTPRPWPRPWTDSTPSCGGLDETAQVIGSRTKTGICRSVLRW
ncbi:NAD(P)-binding domain-containing protein [Nonomuraea typhae]|uniref:NAD(P)-binding domain-containing protein n=1 Tax=Nonomuraea typhae TaxID=2603600 RepID=UPI001FEC5F99|nr:NAD(P)-binding domain-containing protein [Nonomuraea typhae]